MIVNKGYKIIFIIIYKVSLPYYKNLHFNLLMKTFYNLD